MNPIDVTLALLALFFAVLALYAQRPRRIIDPSRTPDELFRTRLTDELTVLISPLTGLKQDLDGLTEVINQLSATDAEFARAIDGLQGAIGALQQEIAQLRLPRRCAECPARVVEDDA